MGDDAPPHKMGVWRPRAPSLGYLLLCLGKVRKVRLERLD